MDKIRRLLLSLITIFFSISVVGRNTLAQPIKPRFSVITTLTKSGKPVKSFNTQNANDAKIFQYHVNSTRDSCATGITKGLIEFFMEKENLNLWGHAQFSPEVDLDAPLASEVWEANYKKITIGAAITDEQGKPIKTLQNTIELYEGQENLSATLCRIVITDLFQNLKVELESAN